MDLGLRVLEREAAAGDPQARLRGLARRVRMGELPVGVVVELDASLVTAGWRSASTGKLGPAPKKLTGLWELTGSYDRRGEPYYWMAKLSKKGKRLKASAANTDGQPESRLRQLLVQAYPPSESTEAKAKVERAPDGAPVIREFSAIGPCLTQGRLVRKTAKFYVLEDSNGRDRETGKMNYSNRRVQREVEGQWSPYHEEACSSCRDHPRTQYPNGYTN